MFRPVRAALAVLSAAVSAACLAPAAHATTMAISTSDAVESLTATVTVSGFAEGYGNQVVATVKRSDAGGCAAGHQADGGTRIITSNTFDTGSYSLREDYRFEDAGDHLICAWMVGPSNTIAASAVVTVRRPAIALTVTAPPVVATGQTFRVGWTWQLEAARRVEVHVVPNAGACPATGAAASAQRVATLAASSYAASAGPSSTGGDVRISAPGSYLACGYVQYKASADPPQLTAAAAFTVGASSGSAEGGPGPADVGASLGPKCRVPRLPRNRRVSTTRAAIRRANCVVGSKRYVRSRKVRAGRVVRLSPRSGLTRAPRAKVTTYISVGRKGCRVPSVAYGGRLSAAKRRIRKAGCRVGRIKRVSSGLMKNGVVRVSPKPGSLRPSKYRVTVYVSRG